MLLWDIVRFIRTAKNRLIPLAKNKESRPEPPQGDYQIPKIISMILENFCGKIFLELFWGSLLYKIGRKIFWKFLPIS